MSGSWDDTAKVDAVLNSLHVMMAARTHRYHMMHEAFRLVWSLMKGPPTYVRSTYNYSPQEEPTTDIVDSPPRMKHDTKEVDAQTLVHNLLSSTPSVWRASLSELQALTRTAGNDAHYLSIECGGLFALLHRIRMLEVYDGNVDAAFDLLQSWLTHLDSESQLFIDDVVQWYFIGAQSISLLLPWLKRALKLRLLRLLSRVCRLLVLACFSNNEAQNQFISLGGLTVLQNDFRFTHSDEVRTLLGAVYCAVAFRSDPWARAVFLDAGVVADMTKLLTSGPSVCVSKVAAAQCLASLCNHNPTMQNYIHEHGLFPYFLKWIPVDGRYDVTRVGKHKIGLLWLCSILEPKMAHIQSKLVPLPAHRIMQRAVWKVLSNQTMIPFLALMSERSLTPLALTLFGYATLHNAEVSPYMLNRPWLFKKFFQVAFQLVSLPEADAMVTEVQVLTDIISIASDIKTDGSHTPCISYNTAAVITCMAYLAHQNLSVGRLLFSTASHPIGTLVKRVDFIAERMGRQSFDTLQPPRAQTLLHMQSAIWAHCLFSSATLPALFVLLFYCNVVHL